MEGRTTGGAAVSATTQSADFMPPSLLDVKKARNPSQPLSRIMVIAGLDGADFNSASLTLSKAVAVASSRYQVTGIALYQQKAVVCVAELFHDATQAFLEALQQSDGKRGGLREVRVAMAVEDCPFRIFTRWSVFDAPVPGDADLDKEDIVNTSYGTYAGLLELGEQLREADEFAEVRRKNAHLLPPGERIAAMAKSPEFMTASAYLELHFAPLEVTMDSERVWPLPAVLDVETILHAQMGGTGR